jgi:glycosyltransferase involved in cell wall biosynthesis
LDVLLWLKSASPIPAERESTPSRSVEPMPPLSAEVPNPLIERDAPFHAAAPVIEQSSAAPRDVVADMLVATSPPTSATQFLVISDCVPTPDLDAGSHRLFQILTLLVQIGHEVTFCADSESGAQHYRDDLARLGIHTVVGADATMAHLAHAGRRYRHVVLSRPEIAFRYLFAVRAHAIHARVALDTVDLHWVRMQGEARVTGDVTIAERAAVVERMELFNAQSSDLILTVSEAERQVLLGRDASLAVEVVPVIHSSVSSCARWNERQDLMFVGSYWHKPNEDAVLYFVQEILPRIHDRLPDVTFNILGSRMPNSIESLAAATVRCIGYVQDLTPYFDRARVFVAPLRFGAGVKGKIVQSMSHGLPVVTTVLGAEGLMVTSGEQVVIADTPDAFADAVVALYTNPELWTGIARRATAHVSRYFSAAVVRRRLEAIFPPNKAHAS